MVPTHMGKDKGFTQSHPEAPLQAHPEVRIVYVDIPRFTKNVICPILHRVNAILSRDNEQKLVKNRNQNRSRRTYMSQGDCG